MTGPQLVFTIPNFMNSFKGHGKLVMADGSFYEGQFIDGEIQGHGFRRWASTRNEYTGQFIKGELNGHGIMVYGDGSRYEGEWVDNQREGEFFIRSTSISLFLLLEAFSQIPENSDNDPPPQKKKNILNK